MKMRKKGFARFATIVMLCGVAFLSCASAEKARSCGGSCAGCSLCGNRAPVTAYYANKEATLLKDFAKRQAAFKPALREFYGEQETASIVSETEAEFRSLIPTIPYIGGDENPRTEDIEQAAMALSLYRVQKNHGRTTDEIGRIIHDSTERELGKYPRWLLRLIGVRFFTEKHIEAAREAAERSAMRQYDFDWVTTFVPGDGVTFDYGCDHAECGVQKYLASNGAADLTPYLCKLDYLYSDAFDEGLVRTSTLADGGPACDFRFKRGRK